MANRIRTFENIPSLVSQTSPVTLGDDAAWSAAKFNTGSFAQLSTTTMDLGSACLRSFSYYRYTIRSMYFRFGTGVSGVTGLEDSTDINSVTLRLYVNSITNTTGLGTASQKIRIYAGITGGSDRPSHSVNPTNPDDWNIYCETHAGCGSGTCNVNEGLVLIKTVNHSDLTTGQYNDISLDSGSGTDFVDWCDRDNFTYMYAIHETWFGDTSTHDACNTSNEAPYSATAAIAVNISSNVTNQRPQLLVSQPVPDNYQMII
tara:strand:- start:13660 stop:14439 length:780 start_codon:yes stop_codon:yes gene_type:complete